MTELEASLKKISADMYVDTKCSLFELLYGGRERKTCICFSSDM